MKGLTYGYTFSQCDTNDQIMDFNWQIECFIVLVIHIKKFINNVNTINLCEMSSLMIIVQLLDSCTLLQQCRLLMCTAEWEGNIYIHVPHLQTTRRWLKLSACKINNYANACGISLLSNVNNNPSIHKSCVYIHFRMALSVSYQNECRNCCKS